MLCRCSSSSACIAGRERSSISIFMGSSCQACPAKTCSIKACHVASGIQTMRIASRASSRFQPWRRIRSSATNTGTRLLCLQCTNTLSPPALAMTMAEEKRVSASTVGIAVKPKVDHDLEARGGNSRELLLRRLTGCRQSLAQHNERRYRFERVDIHSRQANSWAERPVPAGRATPRGARDSPWARTLRPCRTEGPPVRPVEG